MTLAGARPLPDRGEEGFTLPELIAYMSILALVLAIVGGILISSTAGERSIRTRAEATTAGQSVVTSVQAGVRNASFVELDDLTDAQLLTVRTAGSGTTLSWACQAWYYTADDGGSLYVRKTNPAATIAAPTAGNLTGWVLIADGISENGADIFLDVFAGEVDIALVLSTSEGAPIAINSTAKTRTLPTTIAPC